MSDAPLPDPLERFLQDPPRLPASAELHEAILLRTSAKLQTPRRRFWPVAIGLAACIALVLLGAYVFRPVQEEMVPRKEMAKKNVVPHEEKQPETPPPVIVRANPLEMEWQAFDAIEDQERVRLYFQAGDLYLTRLDDYQSALRCYRQALRYCESRDLESGANDNWLVLALKRDHQKEN